MTDAEDLDDLTARYHEYGRALQAAVRADCIPWLEGMVRSRAPQLAPDPAVRSVLDAVADEIDHRLGIVVEAPVDEPISGPLETMRSAMAPLGEWLEARAVPPPPRDPRDVELHPRDRYDLGPMRFVDISPGVHEAGMAWGAAKAFLHRARHRHEDATGPLD